MKREQLLLKRCAQMRAHTVDTSHTHPIYIYIQKIVFEKNRNCAVPTA